MAEPYAECHQMRRWNWSIRIIDGEVNTHKIDQWWYRYTEKGARRKGARELRRHKKLVGYQKNKIMVQDE